MKWRQPARRRQQFPITTYPVSGGNVVATINATLNSLTESATVTLTP